MDSLDPYKYICSLFLMSGLIFLSLIWVYRDPYVVFAIAMTLSISIQAFIYILSDHDKDYFCNINQNRWCPEADRCLPEIKKQEKVNLFLNDTDRFIKELYEFIDPDAPAYAGAEDILKRESTNNMPDSSPDKTVFA